MVPPEVVAAQPTRALILERGAPLQPGRMGGASQIRLERAVGGHTPILTFTSDPGPVRLLLDTGAAASMVTGELAQRLGIPIQPLSPQAFSLAGGGAGCPSLRLASTRLPELHLPGVAGGPSLHLAGMEALVIPGAALPDGVDGVLGAPTLRQVPFVVDPAGGVVLFGPPAVRWRQARGSEPRVVPLAWRRGVPILQVSLLMRGDRHPKQVPALADTGAEGLFLSEILASTLTPVGPAHPVRMVGVCGMEEVRRQSLLGITLDQSPSLASPVEAIVLRNPVFALLGVQAIVGQDWLWDRPQFWRLDSFPPRLELW